MADTPELLYHTTLVVYDGSRDPTNRSRSAFILGTHTSLAAAKAFSTTALQGLGYKPSDFLEYHVKEPSSQEEDWIFGDGVVVYAKAFSGEEFAVGLDTTPNDQGFAGAADGTLILQGISSDHNPAHHLHYVLQTKVDYDQDRCRARRCSGTDMSAFKSTEIQGCFLKRADAIKAAKQCLKSAGYEFAQYDERNDLGKEDDWPFGEDVLVHAVSQTGENYAVAVRTISGAHQKHDKKNCGH
ncbi:hypothetical protein Sste5346_005114 [Sporothrix stenoceras]|uniref:Uncharacterized protein n=1 Tax=Sporothrix stenoceras TaxID=5173 RepID=A0ABR3Z4T9_9PEZI